MQILKLLSLPTERIYGDISSAVVDAKQWYSLLALCQCLDKVSSICCVQYQSNWHWHYYVWASVFVHSCLAWHIPVHARVHSLTLQCVKSGRWCWQTAEHLVSKCSLWPPSSATVSAWNKLFLIWTGIMCSQPSEVPLAPCSRDKNKYRNQGRCDTWALPGKWQQVSGGIAWTSQIWYLVWVMLVDSWDSTSDALSFFFSLFFFYWRTELPEEAAFDCRDSSAAHLKGIRHDVHLLKKRCDPWYKCRPWPECSTSGHWKCV